MDKYKKSDDRDFADLRLPAKYCFRRTELLQDSITVETTADETTSSQSFTSGYPYEIEMYRCSAAVSWLNRDMDGGVWFCLGSGTLTLTMTANLIEMLPYHTAVIVVTNHETGRVLCQEPIMKGLDYSTLQNKHPPTTSQLRCVSFELATGAPMMITCDSLEIATKLWEKTRELQKDVYLT